MAKEKKDYLTIGQYLLSKDGKTKYMKLGYSPKADDDTKKLIDAIIAVIGTDVLFVSIFDGDFKEKFNIPDFVKGSLSISLVPDQREDQSKKSSKKDDSGVNF